MSPRCVSKGKWKHVRNVKKMFWKSESTLQPQEFVHLTKADYSGHCIAASDAKKLPKSAQYRKTKILKTKRRVTAIKNPVQPQMDGSHQMFLLEHQIFQYGLMEHTNWARIELSPALTVWGRNLSHISWSMAQLRGRLVRDLVGPCWGCNWGMLLFGRTTGESALSVTENSLPTINLHREQDQGLGWLSVVFKHQKLALNKTTLTK